MRLSWRGRYYSNELSAFPPYNCIPSFLISFMIGNLLLALWKIPDLVGPTDSWVYFRYVDEAVDLRRQRVIIVLVYSPSTSPSSSSFAAGIWLYSTFDNVDGKQARRTGTSSPLGELFDHGCDALNCSVDHMSSW